MLHSVILSQADEDVNSREFIDRHLAEARRVAAEIPREDAAAARELKLVQRQIADLLVALGDKPSAALRQRLDELEARSTELKTQVAAKAERERLRVALESLDERSVPDWWQAAIASDGTTIDEQRAALMQIIDRVEFDPATGLGQITYRIPVIFPGDGTFSVSETDLGSSERPTGIRTIPDIDSVRTSQRDIA